MNRTSVVRVVVVRSAGFRLAIFLSMIALAMLAPALLMAQSEPPAPRLASAHEFPVTMQQPVVAGQTPPGTKVRAKLVLATLFEGSVIADGAIFTGEVVESSAKSGADPSRLAIRMDSVQWGKESKPIKVFLTAWYYPLKMATRDTEDCQTTGLNIHCPHSADSTPTGLAGVPQLGISDHRISMKDVESTRENDGTLVISSTHVNIKLDKTTTYVLATDDLTTAK
jgi:hypothetical protein